MKHDDSVVIDRLGGTAEVARIFGIKPPSVSEWRTSGIPPARRMYLELIRPEAFCDTHPQGNPHAQKTHTQHRN